MKGLGIVQMKVLEAVHRCEPVTIETIRAIVYPSDSRTGYARKAITVAIKSLERRGILVRIPGDKRKADRLAIPG